LLWDHKLDSLNWNSVIAMDLHEVLDGGRNWIAVKGVFRIGI
jgi:hypothetical protein